MNGRVSYDASKLLKKEPLKSVRVCTCSRLIVPSRYANGCSVLGEDLRLSTGLKWDVLWKCDYWICPRTGFRRGASVLFLLYKTVSSLFSFSVLTAQCKLFVLLHTEPNLLLPLPSLHILHFNACQTAYTVNGTIFDSDKWSCMFNMYPWRHPMSTILPLSSELPLTITFLAFVDRFSNGFS